MSQTRWVQAVLWTCASDQLHCITEASREARLNVVPLDTHSSAMYALQPCSTALQGQAVATEAPACTQHSTLTLYPHLNKLRAPQIEHELRQVLQLWLQVEGCGIILPVVPKP